MGCKVFTGVFDGLRQKWFNLSRIASPGIVEEDCHVPDGVELETWDFKEQMVSESPDGFGGLALLVCNHVAAYRNVW